MSPAQPAPDDTAAQPPVAPGRVRVKFINGWGDIAKADLHPAMTVIAWGDPVTSAQPVPAAGSEPVAWRCRDRDWDDDQLWDYPTERPSSDYAYDIVEPLYATPTPALAPQGDLNSWEANVTAILDTCPYTVRCCEGGGPEDLKGSLVLTFLKMQRRLVTPAPVEPDLLPGLKRAREIIADLGPDAISVRRIDAEIARIEKERQS